MFPMIGEFQGARSLDNRNAISKKEDQATLPSSEKGEAQSIFQGQPTQSHDKLNIDHNWNDDSEVTYPEVVQPRVLTWESGWSASAPCDG